MKIEFCITVEPLIVLLLVAALIILYLIKRGYDWERQQLNAKAQKGQHIY